MRQSRSTRVATLLLATFAPSLTSALPAGPVSEVGDFDDVSVAPTIKSVVPVSTGDDAYASNVLIKRASASEVTILANTSAPLVGPNPPHGPIMPIAQTPGYANISIADCGQALAYLSTQMPTYNDVAQYAREPNPGQTGLPWQANYGSCVILFDSTQLDPTTAPADANGTPANQFQLISYQNLFINILRKTVRDAPFGQAGGNAMIGSPAGGFYLSVRASLAINVNGTDGQPPLPGISWGGCNALVPSQDRFSGTCESLGGIVKG